MMPPRRWTRLAPLTAALALAATACSDAPTAVVFDGPVDLAGSWETASPEAVGMDRRALDRAVERAAGIPRLRSLLVVRRGRLVLERYFADADAEELADVRSVTKSLVSTLTGLAVERGYLEGLDQTLGEIVPPGVAPLDSVERRITLRNLLTMSGGWEWREVGAVGYNEWVTSPDPLAHLLDRPHAYPPGTAFTYSSAAVHLLGVAVAEASRRSLPTLAHETLLGPLGVDAFGWETFPDGRVNGGAGARLRPRDLAKVGQLFLQDGVSGTRRVLPAGWVDEATRARWPWRNDVGPTDLSYGYLWWTDEVNDAYLAWGYGGQFIYVAPRRDLVVVTTTAWWQMDGQSAPADLSTQVLDVVVNGVLPAAPSR